MEGAHFAEATVRELRAIRPQGSPPSCRMLLEVRNAVAKLTARHCHAVASVLSEADSSPVPPPSQRARQRCWAARGFACAPAVRLRAACSAPPRARAVHPESARRARDRRTTNGNSRASGCGTARVSETALIGIRDADRKQQTEKERPFHGSRPISARNPPGSTGLGELLRLTLRPFKVGAMLHRDARKINHVVTLMCNLPHVIFGSPRSGVRLWNTLGCHLDARHGDVQTKAEIQKRLTDTEAKRAKIKEPVGQGKSRMRSGRRWAIRQGKGAALARYAWT